MIEVEQLAVRSGDFYLSGLDFHLGDGEYAILRGPSGAGKTTLLEAICGLRPVVSGRIRLRGVNATRQPPAERSIGYVPQDSALFTTMDVRTNLAYGLVRRGVERKVIDHRVVQIAGLLRIGSLLDRGVATLSGGEARRVALGRSISFKPDILLLDEPLTGLDEQAREEVADALQAAHAETGATVLHVSHDPRDTVRLADRVVVLEMGVLRESAPNQESPSGEQPPLPQQTSDQQRQHGQPDHQQTDGQGASQIARLHLEVDGGG